MKLSEDAQWLLNSPGGNTLQ